MTTERKNIPIINDKLDPYVLYLTIIRSLKYVIIFFIFSFILLYLYLRYTPPTYLTSVIIQVKFEETSKILLSEIIPKKEEINLLQIVELIKSPEFLKRVLSKLPVFVSYYSEGTFLEYDLYKNSPFEIEYTYIGPEIYGKKIYLDFNLDKIIITYFQNKEKIEKVANINETIVIPGLHFKVKIKNKKLIEEQKKKIKEDKYFFVINDTSSTIKKFLSNLQVQILSADANTISINYKDNNPFKAAEIPQKIAQEFIMYDVEKKSESSIKITEFIDQQLSVLYDVIDSLERELYKFKNKFLASDSSSFHFQNQSNISIDNQLINLELDEYGLKKLKEILKNNITNINEIVIYSALINNNSISNIVNKLQTLEDQKRSILINKTKENIEYKIIENQIKENYEVLNKLVEISLSQLEEKKNFLKSKYTIGINKPKIQQEDLDYIRLKRMYDITLSYFNKLLEKKTEFLITKVGNVSKVVLLDNAYVPTKPISPNKTSAMAIAIGIPLILSIMLIFIKYLLFNEITSLTDIQEYTNAKILGILPTYKSQNLKSQLIVINKPSSIFAETLRSCRATIEMMQKNKQQNTIAISSTISGEGKTLISTNLAAIFTFINKKVILLDCDLRKPRIHYIFNLPNLVGISTILTNKTDLYSCIEKSSIKNLDILTSGPIYPNPSELISSKEFENLLKTLSENYDYVVIDTSPVGIVSDALTIFKLVSFPIYVLRFHFSKKAFIYHINHLIDEKKIDSLFVILNGFDYSKSKYSGYQYNYGYGYSYVYGYPDSNKYYLDENFSMKSSLLKRIKKLLTHKTKI